MLKVDYSSFFCLQRQNGSFSFFMMQCLGLYCYRIQVVSTYYGFDYVCCTFRSTHSATLCSSIVEFESYSTHM